MTGLEEMLRDVDVVLDTIGGDTLERSCRVLRRGGTLVSVAASPPPEPSRGPTRRDRAADRRRPDPAGAGRGPAAGPVREAFERGLAGHVRGKIVLRVNESEAIP